MCGTRAVAGHDKISTMSSLLAHPKSLAEAWLQVIEPDSVPREVRVTASPFLVGRGAEAGNHLQLADKRISRRCAAIVLADGVFRLEDRGQNGGVYVNKEKIESHPLREGDLVTFGPSDTIQLVFHTERAQDSLPEILHRLEQVSDLDDGTRNLRQLSLLLEATAMLQSHLPVEEVLGAMVERAIGLIDADRALLLEADAQGELRPLLARERGGIRIPPANVQPSQTAVAHALSRRRSVVEGDMAQASASLREAQSIVAQQLRSVIAIPLLSSSQRQSIEATMVSNSGELLGVLYLDSRRPTAFSGLDLRILDALAHEAASVIEHARLIQKEQQRKRLEQELAIARQIQQALLPKTLQRFRHVEVRGTNRSCLAVGGDYFDLIEVGEDRAAFFIADISGKGLGAALVTAILQGTFSSILLGQESSRVFTHVNQFICNHSEVGRYATAFFGMIDAEGGLEFINIGHLIPLLAHNGHVEPKFDEGSMPLGLFPNTKYQTFSARLEPGDTIVLFTDGVTEQRNPEGEMFGDERLLQVVSQFADGPIDKLEAAIFAAVSGFMQSEEQADDITVLVVRYLGIPPAPGE